jgi:hypothetical protein
VLPHRHYPPAREKPALIFCTIQRQRSGQPQRIAFIGYDLHTGFGGPLADAQEIQFVKGNLATPVDKNCFHLLDMLGTPNCISELIHTLGFPVSAFTRCLATAAAISHFWPPGKYQLVHTTALVLGDSISPRAWATSSNIPSSRYPLRSEHPLLRLAFKVIEASWRRTRSAVVAIHVTKSIRQPLGSVASRKDDRHSDSAGASSFLVRCRKRFRRVVEVNRTSTAR